MSQQEKPPMTLALRELEKHGVELTYHLFTYQEKGGTAHSSKEMGVTEHAVIKTLIMEDENKDPLIVLMHGDMQVSTKNLARTLGKKSIAPCKPEVADRHSGYQVGGTSPFGTKKKMPIYMEETILALPKIYINGGKRGFLVGMDPKQAQKILSPTLVNVGIKG
ncbi:Cys-tRNA(Pro) deacylase [Bdellovibrio sp. KM01]|nr:Cys-tRNA(Pro) deacylase [Bdellovibrio sp. KM01]